MDAILALIGSRWTTYLGMIGIGVFGMFYPAELLKILSFGFVGLGISGIARAYREGAFDAETAEIKATVESLRSKVGL